MKKRAFAVVLICLILGGCCHAFNKSGASTYGAIPAGLDPNQ